jgi:hypothetical protein
MRKLFVTLRTGYCGMTTHELLEVLDNISEEDIDEEIWGMAVEHAASYGIYPPSEYDDEDDEEYQDGSNIEGSYVEYDPEKHDSRLY